MRTVLEIYCACFITEPKGWKNWGKATYPVPEPYQAGDAPFLGWLPVGWNIDERALYYQEANHEDRGWPQTTTLWHPHFNVERTNPLWR